MKGGVEVLDMPGKWRMESESLPQEIQPHLQRK